MQRAALPAAKAPPPELTLLPTFTNNHPGNFIAFSHRYKNPGERDVRPIKGRRNK
jgi:hypothetical protein